MVPYNVMYIQSTSFRVCSLQPLFNIIIHINLIFTSTYKTEIFILNFGLYKLRFKFISS